MLVKCRTIRQLFEYGFEEVMFSQNGKTYYLHSKDFTDGDMKQFYDYTIGRFEREFNTLLRFC